MLGAAEAMAVSAADMPLAADSPAGTLAEVSRAATLADLRAIPDLHRMARWARVRMLTWAGDMRAVAAITAGTAMAAMASSTDATEVDLGMAIVIPTTGIRITAICPGLILIGGGILIRRMTPISANLPTR